VDYLMLLGGRRPPFPRRGIAKSGAWPEFTLAQVAGGVLGYTATTYPGLAPVVNARGATLVLGDPLFDWLRASAKPHGRTAQIVGRLRAEPLVAPAFQPFHPAAILRCAPSVETPRGVIAELRNDALGGAPVFIARGRGFVAISSSPDLIALATGDRLDLLACRELVSQSRVSFPYTLYQGVREAPSGRVLTVRAGRRGLRVTYQTPVAGALGDPIAPVVAASDANGLVGDLMDDLFKRIRRNLGSDQTIACTLSAGLDSRMVLASAVRIMPGKVTAITGSPDDNPELWTAREVASRLGVRHDTATWDPSIMVDRFRTGNGLIFGSHRRWSDGHLQGAFGIFGQPVVIGGFFSDAMMDGGDGELALRTARIADGSIPADSHWSVISTNFLSLDAGWQRRIIRRAEAARRRLDPRFGTVSHFRYSLPATRGVFPAHWISESNEWAQYEPFMTEGAAAIAVACEPLGGPGRKVSLFAETLEAAGLADIPSNPVSASHGRSRAWLAARDVLADSPEFGPAYRRMTASALRMLGVDGAAVRLRHLLVNVYWANRLITKWAPSPDAGALKGRRGVARHPRPPRAT
jgi:hypothetical protein